MTFKKKVVLKEPEFCAVCHKKVSEGKIMNGYEKYANFVCNDCFAKYFRYTAKIEESGIAVNLRPADIRDDEYRMHPVIAAQVVRDMVLWLIISFVMLFSAKYMCGMFYEKTNFLPLPQKVIFLLVAVISFAVFIGTVKKFVSGLMRGMNHFRRILLLAKSAEFLAVGVFAVNYIMRNYN
ncbi:MAG: hypothetical protein IJ666_03380 [Ruminococcus sp.]|nr:hypothetical protein [Ruminococcus sp.]